MLTATPDSWLPVLGLVGRLLGHRTDAHRHDASTDLTVAADFEPTQYACASRSIRRQAATCSRRGPRHRLRHRLQRALRLQHGRLAQPSEHSGFTFTGWTGECTGNGNCDLTMDAAKNVTANFVLTTYTLTVNKAGTGWGDVSSPIGINCGADCSEVYNDGTLVQLTPAAATGTNFTAGRVAPASRHHVHRHDGRDQERDRDVHDPAVLTESDEDRQPGTGTVSFSPGTLVCGPTCTSAGASYNYNMTATLTATPRRAPRSPVGQAHVRRGPETASW